MTLLAGKNALIFGVANDHSIAWGIAKAFHEAGANVAFSYAGEALERRVRPLAASIGSTFVEQCDVSSDEQIKQVFAKYGEQYGKLDILVHGIAYAKREDLTGNFVNTSRDGWNIALEISAYSLIALTQAAMPYFNPDANVLTLSYYGAEKVVQNYNVMGVAKAALEATVRYLAADIGQQGYRVNAISAGPVRTLSAAGIGDFRKLYRAFANVAPMHRNITIEDVGNTATWLCSNMASVVTGEVIYVDAGFHAMSAVDGSSIEGNKDNA